MDVQTLLLFAIASLSINLIPGPDVVYIVSNSMKGKLGIGLKAALGLGVGYFFHTFAAVVGLSALVLNSAIVFSIVKYLGAAYLLYLGVMSVRNMLKGTSSFSVEAGSGSDKGIFKQGVIVSILNPKVALFFLSFLPQFVDVNSGSVTMQLLILGTLFSGLATLCNIVYAVVGSWLFSNPKMARYTRVIEGVSGGLLIVLAGKIALSKNAID
ncbi:LysE family translocator [Vibrio sp. 10N.261.55.A7]|uniref:LysE family translocator n=1 Tax=Vibrio sp. 10N.261.55.A7 TaxID=1880851 RepID=UPI000C81553A|nr:LysE family translocator [Vibrio sp. 10N.261.55.A7]PMJ95705.1 lysine transporter LysE [Vibrio sp. 10N.261.55.A7]